MNKSALQLASFCKLRPEEIRAQFARKNPVLLRVDWPAEFEWCSLLLLSPLRSGFHFGGNPDPPFLRSLIEWQAHHVATIRELKLVKACLKQLAPADASILSLLGLPCEYGGDDGKTLELKSTTASEQASYRLQTFLCPANIASAVADRVEEFIGHFGWALFFEAEEDADLSRNYCPQGDELFLVDDVVARETSEADLRKYISGLERAVDVLSSGGKLSLDLRPWILEQGAIDFVPRARGMWNPLSARSRLMWSLVRLRARLIRQWDTPIFYRAAWQALSEARGFLGALTVRAQSDWKSDLESYCESTLRQFEKLGSLDIPE